MGHIFISYSRADVNYAMRLAGSFEALGIPYWIDERRLTVGVEWAQEIEEGVKNSLILTVIMTTEAEASDWVNREISVAEENKKTILPLLLNGICFQRLRNLQYESVKNRKLPSEDFYHKVTDLLSTFLAKPISSDTTKQYKEADLKLLARLWPRISSRKVQVFYHKLVSRILEEEQLSELIGYLDDRSSFHEYCFLNIELTKAFAEFEETLEQLTNQISSSHDTTRIKEQNFLTPHYKLREYQSEALYHRKAYEHEKDIKLAEKTIEAHQKLVEIIKRMLPEFEFPSDG